MARRHWKEWSLSLVLTAYKFEKSQKKKKKKEEKKKRIIGHRATQPLYKGLVCNFTRPLSISELLIPSPLLTLPPFAATNAAAESIFLRLGLGFPLIPNAILRRVPDSADRGPRWAQTPCHPSRLTISTSRSRSSCSASHYPSNRFDFDLPQCSGSACLPKKYGIINLDFCGN